MAVGLIGCHSGSSPSDQFPSGHGTGFLAEAVTTFYDDQGVRYLTRQFFEIDPENESMVITSDEPEGSMRWSIRGDQYTGPAVGTAKAWFDRRTAKAILTAFMAGSGMLDESAIKPGDPIKVVGQWYQPMTLSDRNQTKVTVYKKQNKPVMDRVEVADIKTGVRIIGLAYNPIWNAASEKSVITKIDISMADRSGSRRLMQVHFQTITYQP
jgi:hypothetical protein